TSPESSHRVPQNVMEKHDAPDSQYPQEAMMFAPIMKHRPLLRHCKAHGIRCGDFAAVMNCLCTREKDYLPSRIPTTPAPINIITVHKQVFIQQAYGLKGFATHHGEATNQNVDSQRLIMSKEKHVLPGKKPGSRQGARQSGCRTKVVPQ